MNAYDLLGVAPGADPDAIKRAYRGLAKALHPDVNAGDAAASERFKEITAAYNLLADRARRAEYDLTRAMRDGPAGDAEPWRTGGAWFDFKLDESTGERLNDLFGDIAGTRMGRVKGVAATSLRMTGQDVAETLRVTASEARDGVVRLVTSMTGITVAVTVPAGTKDGARITLAGFGIEGFGGGAPGDLNVRIRIAPDPAIGARDDPADG